MLLKKESLCFKKFELDDQDVIRQIVNIYRPLSCEYNFPNLFSWQKSSKLSWAMYHDRLLIYEGIGKSTFMPLGKDLDPKELRILSKILVEEGRSPNFTIFTEDYIKRFPEIENFYILEKDRDSAEYIYDVRKMFDLKGIKLTKKRNLISQFKKLNADYQIKTISNKNKNMVLDFSKDLLNKQKKFFSTLYAEIEAIETALSYFKEIKLEGVILLVKNRIVAFSIFSPIDDLTYDIHFEKSDPGFKGAPQIINYKTAEYLKGKCKYINKEQDLGIEGLRKAKLSYAPESLLAMYNLILI